MLPLFVALALLAVPEAEEPPITFHRAILATGAAPPAGYDRLPNLETGSTRLDVSREVIVTAMPICFSVTPAAETSDRQARFELTLQVGNGEADPLLAWSSAHIGEQLAMVLDGEVVSDPTVQVPVRGRVAYAVGGERLERKVRKLLTSIPEC